MRRLAEQKKDQKVGVFNPMTKDFSWKYDRKEYTIPKGEMVEFDYVIGHHMAKHLIDRILTEKGFNTSNSKRRKIWTKKVLI